MELSRMADRLRAKRKPFLLPSRRDEGGEVLMKGFEIVNE